MDDLAELRRLLRETQALTAPVSANGHAQITVSAGGIGVWIAAMCCVVMLVVALFLGLLYVDHSRKIDSLNDYLNAIYMQAPHLKPESK